MDQPGLPDQFDPLPHRESPTMEREPCLQCHGILELSNSKVHSLVTTLASHLRAFFHWRVLGHWKTSMHCSASRSFAMLVGQPERLAIMPATAARPCVKEDPAHGRQTVPANAR